MYWRQDLGLNKNTAPISNPISCTKDLRLLLSQNNMASTTAVPRFLLPRGDLLFRSRLLNRPQLILRQPKSLSQQSCCYASTDSSKPKVLEKPTKFNPPSHPQRLARAQPRSYPGPPLSDAQLQAQKTKQYPNMMPPEGSFMYWFLNNRRIHLWISLVRSFFATGDRH